MYFKSSFEYVLKSLYISFETKSLGVSLGMHVWNRLITLREKHI